MNIRRLSQIQISQDALDIWILILRILIAAFMLTHGLPKLSRLFGGGEIRFGDPIGIGATASLILTVFSEVICSILIGIGLLTRLSTIPLIITMAVAGLISHGPDPFGRKELALLYILVYVTLLILGSGKYSLDYFINRKGSNFTHIY